MLTLVFGCFALVPTGVREKHKRARTDRRAVTTYAQHSNAKVKVVNKRGRAHRDDHEEAYQHSLLACRHLQGNSSQWLAEVADEWSPVGAGQRRQLTLGAGEVREEVSSRESIQTTVRF